MVQYCFTSTETMRLVRTDNPGRRPPQLTHSWLLNSEDGHLDFHTFVLSQPLECLQCVGHLLTGSVGLERTQETQIKHRARNSIFKQLSPYIPKSMTGCRGIRRYLCCEHVTLITQNFTRCPWITRSCFRLAVYAQVSQGIPG